MASTKNYIYIADIPEKDKYPFTLGAVRRMFRDRKANGLAKYTIRVGRRLLVQESDFDKWLEEKREESRWKDLLQSEGVYVEAPK